MSDIESIEKSLYGTPKNRVRLIQDYLYALFTLYPKEQFSLHTVINIMLLLFQRPLAVSISLCTRGGMCKAFYYSVHDPHLKAAFRAYVRQASKHAKSPHLVPIPKTRYRIGLYELKSKASSNIGSKEPLSRSFSFHPASSSGPYSPISLLRCLLRKIDSDPIIPEVFGSLSQQLDARYDFERHLSKQEESERGQQGEQAGSFSETSENDIASYIERIREDLLGEAIYSSIADSPLITRFQANGYNPNSDTKDAEEVPPVPNAFFIIRTAAKNIRYDVFDYTLRFLFPKQQLKQIVEHMKKRASLCNSKNTTSRQCKLYSEGQCGIQNMGSCIYHDICPPDSISMERIGDLLQSPLGPDARMIADSCFCSGILDFSSERVVIGEGRHRSRKDNPADLHRFRIISCLIHQINESSKAFLYPIMVSGKPWLTVSTIIREDCKDPVSAHSWMTTFHFARSILRGKIIDRFRFGTKVLYFKLLEEEFLRFHRKHYNFKSYRYHDIPGMVANLNIVLGHLALVFPYDQIELNTEPFSDSPEGKVCNILHNEQLFCRLLPNSNFPLGSSIIPERQFLCLNDVVHTLEGVSKDEFKQLSDGYRSKAEEDGEETADINKRRLLHHDSSTYRH